MSKQEEESYITDIWIEKRSIYDQDGKFGKDSYFLTFNFGFKQMQVDELFYEDLENLHKLLGKVINAEKECQAIVDKSVKDITFTEE